MNKAKQNLKATATENFDLYKEDWLKGYISTDELAEQYHNEENWASEDCIEESLEDYKKWVSEAWHEWFYEFIEEEAGINEDGTDGNGFSVEDILAKRNRQEILRYLGWY